MKIPISFIPYEDRGTVKTVLVDTYLEGPSASPVCVEALRLEGGVLIVERVQSWRVNVREVKHVLLYEPFFFDCLYEMGGPVPKRGEQSGFHYEMKYRDIIDRNAYEGNMQVYNNAVNRVKAFMMNCKRYVDVYASHSNFSNILIAEV